MKFKNHFFLVLFCLSLNIAGAQEQPLPNNLTAAEESIVKNYLDSITSSLSLLTPNPPPAPVRTMAEWEEVQAILISWVPFYDDILGEIVRHSVGECKVVIFTYNVNVVTGYLTANNIPMDNVIIIDSDYDSIWIRDYGPWTVYHNDVDSLMIVDWIYNRPRPDDDLIPSVAADYFDLPIYEAIEAPNDWVHTGGNNLRDGLGTNFSSKLVFDENPDKTEAEIDEIANLFLGAQRYIKFDKLPYDLIHHLDMHMRFIDEETLIMGEYPTGVADGPQIEANLNYFVNEVPTAFGNQYNIIRIPMPPDFGDDYPPAGDYRTYTNSIFVNKTILVPIYEEQYDTTALRIYEEALPGYNVVGIDCNDIIPAYGALHCITKLVGVHDPLWIAHPKLRDTEDNVNDYPAMAIIKHKSGIEEATLHYRQKGDISYTSIDMALTNAEENIWTAAIPAQLPGTTIEYYIHARANDGKEQVRPLVAPEGYFQFNVGGVVSSAEDINVLEGLEFSVFPNPAIDFINLTFEAEKATAVTIFLSNALGQEAQLMDQEIQLGTTRLQVPLNRLSRGTYEITVQQGNKRSTKKILIAK
jgi:agmatine deiminase